MIVAEIAIHVGGFGDRGILHTVRFDSLEEAKAEFDRIAELVKRSEERANDKPVMLEVKGSGSQMTAPLNHVRSIGLSDYAHTNAELAGVRDAFPNVFKF